MVVNVSFDAETEAKLQAAAKAAGKPVEHIVREVVEERFKAADVPSSSMTVEQRLLAWRDWVASHPRRDGVNLDDSRESIYAERG